MGTKSGDGHASPRSSDTATSLELMVTPPAHSGPCTTIQRRPRGGNLRGEWRQRWKHHPSFDFLASSRRAPREQRCQRRTLVESSATTHSQGQSHPRGEQGARRHTPIVTQQVGLWRSMTAPSGRCAAQRASPLSAWGVRHGFCNWSSNPHR